MEEEQQETNPVSYILPLATGIAVMAACGVVGFTLALLAFLITQ